MANDIEAPDEKSGTEFEAARPPVISEADAAGGELEEHGMQHGGTHGPAKDEALKRITRSHPRRDIPRIESVDPVRAPAKE